MIGGAIQSNWMNALFTLVINLGTSYVVTDVNNIFKGVFAYKFMKWLVVFAICFASTKDIYVSIVVSFFFTLIVWFLLDEGSDFSLPKIRTLLHKTILRYTNEEE